MLKKFVTLLLIVLFCGNLVAQNSNEMKFSEDSSDFVRITDVAPDVILEIRYFGTYNFVGTRVDGYEMPVAWMTREAADSLKAVSDDVKAMGYRLKIYDAYRPHQAVDHLFVGPNKSMTHS